MLGGHEDEEGITSFTSYLIETQALDKLVN